jgi:phosphoribosylformimino-5-aminoimidazole carboxamide ribotide isomerase
MLIIPAIDLKGGQCVRLTQGNMANATVFSSNPVEMAQKWQNLGCKRLHIVDLDGAFAGKPENKQVIQAIVKTCPNLAIQVGGGIRTLEMIEEYLSCGISYVILGTIAASNPDFVKNACKLFPNQIIIGIDAKNGFVATDGWANVTNIQAQDLALQYQNSNVGGIIYTDIARDGMMQGVNLEETLKMTQAGIPIIASGGIKDINDIINLANTHKIAGAICGRSIYEGTLDLIEAFQVAQ